MLSEQGEKRRLQRDLGREGNPTLVFPPAQKERTGRGWGRNWDAASLAGSRGERLPYSATERGCFLTEAVALEPSQGLADAVSAGRSGQWQNPLCRGWGQLPKGILHASGLTPSIAPATLIRSGFLPGSPSPLATVCQSPGLSHSEGGGRAPGSPVSLTTPPHILCSCCCPRQTGVRPCACFVSSVPSPPRRFSSRPGKGTARGTWQASLRPRAARGGGSVPTAAAAGGAWGTGAAPSPLCCPKDSVTLRRPCAELRRSTRAGRGPAGGSR